MEEHELIQRLRRGDDDAFETIFRKYFPVLCLFADNYVRNKQAAEEIVEDEEDGQVLITSGHIILRQE
ncbi:MAG TPA: hypothetical protein VJ203_15995 [Bacteroidales bacterium]|nr:hypothetical protein [Bacteroidales bacterium]